MKEGILSTPSPLGDPITFYKNTWTGPGSDAILSIVAGLQGDRLNGIWVASRLSRFLQDIEEGKEKDFQLSGTVQIFPVVNLLALESARQSWSFDNLDMDLAFPGSELGDLNEKIREALVRHSKDSTYGIILQTGDTHYEDFPHLQVLEPNRHLRRTACLFGLKLCRCVNNHPALNLSLVNQWRQNGVQSVIVSAGSSQTINHEFGNLTFTSVLNFMTGAGFLKHPGQNDETVETKFYNPENQLRLTASKAGLFRPDVPVGTTLEKGQRVGELTDIYNGKTVEELTAPEGGILVSMRTYPLVYQQESVAVILTERKQPWYWPFT